MPNIGKCFKNFHVTTSLLFQEPLCTNYPCHFSYENIFIKNSMTIFSLLLHSTIILFKLLSLYCFIFKCFVSFLTRYSRFLRLLFLILCFISPLLMANSNFANIKFVNRRFSSREIYLPDSVEKIGYFFLPTPW